jgi:UDPglucose--hexose-1-phosphate uridylyltransferase
VRKTSKRLADGREIIYFDRDPLVERRAEDGRQLSLAELSSELRYDPILRTWVMYASHRQERSYLPSAQECPLCPSTDGHATEVPEANYEVVVFENRYPALARHGDDGHGGHDDGHGHPSELLADRAGAGRCEVVCYTSDHYSSFAELGPGRIDVVVDALTDRTRVLGAMDGTEQVFCFENKGAEIGVTQPHPHGQIYAYPFVPLRVERMLAAADDYRSNHHRNLYEDVLDAERADGSRLVLATQHWTAFVPHAARWPYELHCYPNQRVADLAALGPEARSELPVVLQDVFTRFARLFDQPAPYIAAWYQAPVHRGRTEFALHLELFTPKRTNDKLKYLAGSESAMDAYANDVLPEAAAQHLREAADVPVRTTEVPAGTTEVPVRT